MHFLPEVPPAPPKTAEEALAGIRKLLADTPGMPDVAWQQVNVGALRALLNIDVAPSDGDEARIKLLEARVRLLEAVNAFKLIKHHLARDEDAAASVLRDIGDVIKNSSFANV